MEDKIKNSEFVDVPAKVLDDVAPEQLIKVYPYQMVNADKSNAFIQDNTVSIVAISQEAFRGEDVFHQLAADTDGNLFFELLASVTVEGKLDITTATSTVGLELKYEHSFTGITDQYYDHRNEKAIMFTIGEPFDEAKYEKGEIGVFIANTIIPAQEFTVGSVIEVMQEDINQETLTEISFINMTSLEAQFTNARLLFTKNINLSKNVSTFDGNKGITMGIENGTLIGSIKAKGEVKELDKDGNDLGTLEGDIDLVAKDK